MTRRDVEFRTSDQVTLRGWFYTPTGSDSSRKLPCIVLSHGFTALKEMDLDAFAEYFTAKLPLTALVYDNRGFGTSDTAANSPRHEIIPSIQISDISDAITYAQSLPEVDASKIGIWGSSYSGGHVLQVAAFDRRVKAVISQVPLVNGWENFHRLVRPDFIPGLQQQFATDRLGRLAGDPPAVLPVVSEDPSAPSALPTPDSYTFFSAWQSKSTWKNEVTVKSMELLASNNPDATIQHISPTPLLVVVAENDVLTPTDLTIKAYQKALEPKALEILPGGHFDAYQGPNFDANAGRQAKFLEGTLCRGLV